MFEGLAAGDAPAEAVPEPAAPVTAEMLRSWIAGLACLDRRVEDAERVTQLELLERLKSAAAAAQAEVTVDFAASQRAGQIAAGVPAGKAGAGVGAQVGLARRDSPFRGGRLPRAGAGADLRAAGHDGRAAGRGHSVSGGPPWWPGRRRAWTRPTGGWRTPSSARCWPGWGTGRCEAAARAVAYRLDPRAFVDRPRARSRTGG